MSNTQFIYGLVTKGEDAIWYVGRTDSIARRLREHLNDGDPHGTPKQKKIHEVLEAGQQIDIKILEVGSDHTLQGKEDLYISNFRGRGIELTNSREGDSPRLTFVAGVFMPLDVDRFLTAEWKAHMPKCKVGEKSCWLNGVQFFRSGQRKLRFWHTHHGDWDVGGSTMEVKYKNAIEMLTPGTAKNTKLKEDVAMVRRLKG
ncbi:MAG: GIY-YIG nuclease family protein [Steroidobacteraceae bacterium]